MNKVYVGMVKTKNRKSVIPIGMLRALEQMTEKGEPMTALEYMERQAEKCQRNYLKELVRGASKDVLLNIATKFSHYMTAVEALRIVANVGEIDFDYNAEDDK